MKVQTVVCHDRLAGPEEEQSAWPAFSEVAGAASAQQEQQPKAMQGVQKTTQPQQQPAPAMQASKREGAGSQSASSNAIYALQTATCHSFMAALDISRLEMRSPCWQPGPQNGMNLLIHHSCFCIICTA